MKIVNFTTKEAQKNLKCFLDELEKGNAVMIRKILVQKVSNIMDVVVTNGKDKAGAQGDLLVIKTEETTPKFLHVDKKKTLKAIEDENAMQDEMSEAIVKKSVKVNKKFYKEVVDKAIKEVKKKNTFNPMPKSKSAK